MAENILVERRKKRENAVPSIFAWTKTLRRSREPLENLKAMQINVRSNASENFTIPNDGVFDRATSNINERVSHNSAILQGKNENPFLLSCNKTIFRLTSLEFIAEYCK